MIWLFVFITIVLMSFGVVLLFGAPYLPTLTPQVSIALELSHLKAGATLLELGCGDGKVLIAAAQQGISVVGYELNPILVCVAWIRTRKYKSHVRIIWGNFWSKSWPPTDAIFVFLLPKYMPKLDKKCMRYTYRPVKLVSFAFEIPNKKPTREKAGVFLYSYA